MNDQPTRANGEVSYEAGLNLLAQGEYGQAIEHLQRAVRAQPGAVAYNLNLGVALESANRPQEAAHWYGRAFQLAPDDPKILRAAASFYRKFGMIEATLGLLEKLGTVTDLTFDDHLMFGRTLLELQQIERALDHAEQAVDLEPDNIYARLLRSTLFRLQGRFDLALQELDALLSKDPDFRPAYWHITQCKKITNEDSELVSRMQDLANRLGEENGDAALLHLALGNAYNDRKEYQEAMAEYDVANTMFAQTNPVAFDRRIYEASIERIIETFSPEFMERYRSLGQSTELPIFIVGMPRSGTTLAEQILSSHPQVAGGGEIPFWNAKAPQLVNLNFQLIDRIESTQAAKEYIDLLKRISPDADRVTDKLPLNYLHLGLISILFPNAHIVHCQRHPVDTLISIYSSFFRFPPAFAYDKGNMVAAYRAYARLMAHWRRLLPSNRLIEIRYEDLVTEPESQSRRLIEFCGLPWNDSCLHPERNTRNVSSLSQWQVRQPVYNSSLERWRNYEPWLGEFRSLIDQPVGE